MVKLTHRVFLKTSVHFVDVISYVHFKVLHFFLVCLCPLDCNTELDFAFKLFHTFLFYIYVILNPQSENKNHKKNDRFSMNVEFLQQ